MALKYPAFTLPLALVFWGWQSAMLPAAAVILLLVTLSRHTPWRWEMGIAEFHRVGDLTAVLFGFSIIYFYSTESDIQPVYALLRWLPVLSSPLLFGQLYSMGQLLPLSALFYSMRRYGNPLSSPRVDIRLPYAFLCVLAGGSGNASDQSFYVGAAAFTLCLLWSNRPKRQPGIAWLSGFSLAVFLGYGLQIGLGQLQAVVEEWAVEWFVGWEPDPFKARTSIGDRGTLKLSSRVLLKVSGDKPKDAPLLLKEAVYDRYTGKHWATSNAIFQAYKPPQDLGPYRLTVLHLLAQHSVLLALPPGVRGLDVPAQAELSRNRLGTVKWQDTPPIVRYGINYDPDRLDDTAPSATDVELSPSTLHMLTPIVESLGLVQRSPNQAVATIGNFFATHFAYAMDLRGSRSSDEALQDFLYRRQAGHCEYFATATALLLRAAHIPARYVVGFSTQEYVPSEKVWLVRKRHAHAWTEAYVDGAWRTLDNTASHWAEEEAKTDPWWQAIADQWSNWAIRFQIWQWERSQHPQQGFPWWGWLVLPLGAWLGWRLYRSRKRVVATQLIDADAIQNQSIDAEYSRLEQRLLAAGHPPRNVGETPLRWLRRLGLNHYEDEILAYYRRRFGGRQ